MKRFLAMISIIFLVGCIDNNLWSMNDQQKDEAFVQAREAELAREVAVARDIFLQASIDGNNVLMERILGLFPVEYHDDIKLFATCRAQWRHSYDVKVAVNSYFNARIRHDYALCDRIFELIDDNQYRTILITDVNARVLEEDPFAVPVRDEDEKQVVPETNELGDQSLGSADFISEANASAISDEAKNFGSVEDDRVRWTYDMSDGFDNAWLLIHTLVKD